MEKLIFFVCPKCKENLYVKDDKHIYCSNTKCSYFSISFIEVDGKYVLIDFDKSIAVKEDFEITQGESNVIRRNKSVLLNLLKKLIFGVNNQTIKNYKYLSDELNSVNSPKILIVGGGELGAGMSEFMSRNKNNIISFDIYNSPHVDFIGDAHSIPCRDNFFDLVIIQAVLEHVLNPSEVVSEIYRVLKKNGLVYAETPFMQQVHEGPYDFTRFTESGHRYLFKNFKLIKSGYTKGVGTALLWSIDYFFSGIFRNRLLGKIIKSFFFWLRFFDKFVPNKYNIDGASGNYFIGSKNEVFIENELDIVEYYNGAQ